MPPFPASQVPERSRRGAGPAGPAGGPDKPALFQGFVWAYGNAAASIAANNARKTRRGRMAETSCRTCANYTYNPAHSGEHIMRQIAVVATVALLLLVTGNPRAQAYVKASNPGVNDHFGSSVALSRDGNTMAVAAHWESSAATGVNGNQNDDSIPQAGAVYVFTRTGTTWTQQAYIKASNTGKADE